MQKVGKMKFNASSLTMPYLVWAITLHQSDLINNTRGIADAYFYKLGPLSTTDEQNFISDWLEDFLRRWTANILMQFCVEG